MQIYRKKSCSDDEPKFVFAERVKIQTAIVTKNGQTQTTNDGDFIVFAMENGQIDANDRWVKNGTDFFNEYEEAE